MIARARRLYDAWRQRDGRWRALYGRAPAGECVAIDLETSSLDVADAQILSLAAIPVAGRRVLASQALRLHVRSDAAPDREAIKHHRLRPQDLAGGVEIGVALEALLEMLGPRPLLGWCLPFDRALLDRELLPRFGFRLPNPGIDLRYAWERHARRRWPEREPELALDAIAAALGVPVLDRHDAYGDALTTALCWVALQALPR